MLCERVNVTKTEIDERWSIIDLLDCHILMDVYEELDRKEAAKARAQSKRS